MVRSSTPDVSLRPLDAATAAAVLEGRRLPDWAVGYPTPGDLDVARWSTERRNDPDGRAEAFRPFQILAGPAASVVGGIGCHRPPDATAAVEIGYGIAPEWRGQGITTEAVRLLVDRLARAGVRTVVARTDRDNLASQAVLRHIDFVQVRTDPDGLLRWERPLATPRP